MCAQGRASACVCTADMCQAGGTTRTRAPAVWLWRLGLRVWLLGCVRRERSRRDTESRAGCGALFHAIQ